MFVVESSSELTREIINERQMKRTRESRQTDMQTIELGREEAIQQSQQCYVGYDVHIQREGCSLT